MYSHINRIVGSL